MKGSKLKLLIKECIREILNESYEIKLWFTPSGKTVKVNNEGSHENWIRNNTDIPIGKTLIDTYENAISRGYIRGVKSGYGLTLSNLPNYGFDLNKVKRSVKQSIEDYVVNNDIEMVVDGRGNLIKDFIFN